MTEDEFRKGPVTQPLNALIVILVFAGILGTALLGATQGFDGIAVIIFVLVVSAGALVLAAARRAKTGMVEPARCRACGGLFSPSAPYCKHCGAAGG